MKFVVNKLILIIFRKFCINNKKEIWIKYEEVFLEKNKIYGVILYLFLVFGLLIVVFVFIEYVEGGIWSYGVGSKYVWFYYYYGYKGYGVIVSGKYRLFSGYIRVGVKVLIIKYNWWVNRVYYNIY